MNIRTATTASTTAGSSCKKGPAAHLRRRVAFVGLAAALGLSTTACQFGSSGEHSVAADSSAASDTLPGPIATTAGVAPAGGSTAGPTGAAPAEPTGNPTGNPTGIGADTGLGTGQRPHVAADPDPSGVSPADDPALPAADPAAPVVVIVTAPQPTAPQPTLPPTTLPHATTPPATTPPTAPPMTTPETTTPTTMPPTTVPPTTMPPTTLPPTTLPPTTLPPTTLPPTTVPPTTAAPASYFVTVSQLQVKAGDCVQHATDTSTFIEGWGGATGAPQYHLQTYVSTTSATEIGEPAYTVTTAAPGSRAVWGSVAWSFPFVTQPTTLSFNVLNLGTTTVRDHRSVTMLDGVSTCTPEISYSITVAPV